MANLLTCAIVLKFRYNITMKVRNSGQISNSLNHFTRYNPDFHARYNSDFHGAIRTSHGTIRTSTVQSGRPRYSPDFTSSHGTIRTSQVHTVLSGLPRCNSDFTRYYPDFHGTIRTSQVHTVQSGLHTMISGSRTGTRVPATLYLVVWRYSDMTELNVSQFQVN